MRRMIVPPAALAVVLSLVPQAVASSASVEPQCRQDPTYGNVCSSRVVVTAAPGERNRINFRGLAPAPDMAPDVTVVTVEDLGAPLQAGKGCVQVSANKVRCDPETWTWGRDLERQVISTGDGADRVTTVGDVTVLGGSGNDRILTGNGNVVRLRGEAGDDRLHSTSSSPAILEGGPGNDALSGKNQQTLRGNSGNDRLTGSADSDFMNGGSGRDLLLGKAGGDQMQGGPGRDRILGGKGQDEIVSRDGSRDRVDCGRGRDRLRADGRDRARRCERVRRR